MKEEQDIDKIFSQKLSEPIDQPAYRESDWDALEQLLNGGKNRRGIVYWLPVLTSAAAILLLVLGWWLFKPQVTDEVQNPKKQLTKTQQLKKLQTTNTDDLVAKNNPTQSNVVKTTPLRNNDGNTILLPAQEKSVSKPFKMPRLIPHDLPVAGPIAIVPNQNIPTTELVAVKPRIEINTAKIAEVSVKNIITNDYVKSLAVQRNKITATPGFSHPQFALAIMGAPDMNGVNSFQQAKTGANVGLLFSIGVNKLKLTTGVAYSYKPYNTPFNGYQNNGYAYNSSYTFKANPINVLADCRMLDIPLNIDYQLFNKNQNKFSIGTGLSSYIMLKESYTYEYANPATVGQRGYSVASPGKYLFGVLNLQATYTRQVNAKVGVSVQPYLKLPLGEVGASQVRLQSAGVAVGLSWNINSLTKP